MYVIQLSSPHSRQLIPSCLRDCCGQQLAQLLEQMLLHQAACQPSGTFAVILVCKIKTPEIVLPTSSSCSCEYALVTFLTFKSNAGYTTCRRLQLDTLFLRP